MFLSCTTGDTTFSTHTIQHQNIVSQDYNGDTMFLSCKTEIRLSHRIQYNTKTSYLRIIINGDTTFLSCTTGDTTFSTHTIQHQNVVSQDYNGDTTFLSCTTGDTTFSTHTIQQQNIVSPF